MKTMLMIASLLIMLCGGAIAGVVHDIRTGAVPVGAYVTVPDAVVTAVMGNSFVIAEAESGPRRSVWVYAGAAPTVTEGDVVEVVGTHILNGDRTAISLLHPAEARVTVTGTAVLPDNQLTVAELLDDPEGWASTRLFVSDGLIVQELLDDGLWRVTSFESGLALLLDDYFGLYPDARIAECYNDAEGVFILHEGRYVLKVLAVTDTDCTVSAETASFGAVKQMYR